MIWTLFIAAKSTLVLGAAAAVAGVLRRSSASARHALWVLALLSLLVLPVLSLALPGLGLPLLFAPTLEPSHWEQLVTSPLEAVRAPLDAGQAPPSPLSWQGWVLLVWLAGVSLGLIQIVSGTIIAAMAARQARPVTSAEWSALLASAAKTLGVRQRVELRVSDAVDVPIVWGYRSPVVLLPPKATSWRRRQRRATLLHELAHVARHDCLIQTMAYAVRALYWPHPLAWWAVASLRRETERACDDRVLRAGAAAPEYARYLLETARDLTRRASQFRTAPAAAGCTRLGDRVRAILDEHLDRRVPTRRATALLGSATLVAVGILAAAEPVAAGGVVAPPHAQARTPADAELDDWIAHEPFGCLVEARFTEIDATIEPASEVVEARLYFSSAASEERREFWVKMTRDGSRFVGRLPKPRARASPIRYRIEAHHSNGRVVTTDRHSAVVATSESRCPEQVRIAPLAESDEPVTVNGTGGSGT